MLAETFGPDVTYNPVTSYRAPGYLQGDRALRDFRTGDPLTIAGGMRCVCHASVATAEGLDLLREAGHRLPPLLVFGSEAEYDDLLRGLAGETMVFQHAHAQTEFENYWIPRRLLQTINNKANLPELVPAHQRPRRLDRPERPCVIKRATDWTTGGGRSVRICREDPGDIDGFVIEEYIDFEETWCIQFATSGERIVELGFAPQITTPSGRFLGSWFDMEKRIPAAIQNAARAIMERAVARGYRGVAGFDVGSNGLFFDLNFRLNGSTAPLLNVRRASDWLDARFLQSGSWQLPSLRVARDAYRARRFWPLSTYVCGDDCRVSGIIPAPRSWRPQDPPASFPRS
ncbi:MAG: hypothetical protein ACYTEG_13455 [Planctomycetota bacterium]